MANYIIIGGDGKEYGPVPDADVRLWIAEGRLKRLQFVPGDAEMVMMIGVAGLQFGGAGKAGFRPGPVAKATQCAAEAAEDPRGIRLQFRRPSQPVRRLRLAAGAMQNHAEQKEQLRVRRTGGEQGTAQRLGVGVAARVVGRERLLQNGLLGIHRGRFGGQAYSPPPETKTIYAI